MGQPVRRGFRPALEPLEDRFTPAPIQFAVIGDYGGGGAAEADVADLVKSWNPDLILTVGDNNYPSGQAGTLHQNIGQFYGDFIATDRFFPALGNHDWATAGAQPYLDYFDLPGNERYYTFTRGPVQFFAVDSDQHEPDGTTSTSVQAQWLRDQLAASSALWKVVYLHHAPYSSGPHGSETNTQWPFRDWGASVILSGHDHIYERLIEDGLPYFVNGVGGKSITSIQSVVPGSQFRYDDDYGAMRVAADEAQITFEFINRAGVLLDSYTVQVPGLPTVSISALDSHAAEQDGDPAAFSFIRSGDPSVPLTVSYTTSGTAVGADYSPLPGSITIPAGSTGTTLFVTPTEDDRVEGSESLVISLSASGAYTLAASSSAEMAIADNDDNEVELVVAGSTWRYMDDGLSYGTAWREPAFDDSSWQTGRAQFGYGDGDEATVISYGPDTAARHITKYFRQAFTVADTSSMEALVLRLLRDDGAIVYLNGTEVLRSNMPDGAVYFKMRAATAVSGLAEKRFFEATGDPALLVNGVNVLAVELHQASLSSPDASFDLSLTAALFPFPNTPPVMGDVADLSVAEDGTAAIGVHIEDAESPAEALSFAVASSNEDLIGAAHIVLGGSGTERTITLAPAANRFGTADITVTVGDGRALTSATFVLTVLPAADAPSVTPASTRQGLQTSSGLVITRHAADDAEVSHFKITHITNGSLFLSDGIQPIGDGDFIPAAAGNAGLRFTPTPGLTSPASSFGFMVQAAIGNDESALSDAVTAAVTVEGRSVSLDAGGTPSFYWDQVPGAVAYDIWVSDLVTGQSPVLRNPAANGTSWTSATALTPGHRYRWWVGVVGSDGTTDWGLPADFELPSLAAPAPLGPVDTIHTDVPTFTWTEVESAVRYDVWVDDLTTGRSQALRNETAAGSSWTPSTALAPGHRYRWWVGAVGSDGTTVWSPPADFELPSLAAPAPLGPIDTIYTDVPTFTWTEVELALRYDVWVDDLTTGRSPALRNETAAGSSWTTSTALAPGHRYRWWVAAVSGDGTAGWSVAEDFVVPELTAPTALEPAGTLATDAPVFSWTAVAIAAHYDVWVDDLNAGQSQVLRNPSVVGTSWTATSALSAGHRHRWWVAAVSGDGTTAWSSHLDFTVPAFV